jgi:hypothetical protein
MTHIMHGLVVGYSCHQFLLTTAPSGLHINVRHQSWATAGLRIALVWEYKNVVSEMQGMDNLDPGLQDVQKKIAKVLEVSQDLSILVANPAVSTTEIWPLSPTSKQIAICLGV